MLLDHWSHLLRIPQLEMFHLDKYIRKQQQVLHRYLDLYLGRYILKVHCK